MSRRTLSRLAGFLVLVALAPVLATLAWPHYRPPLRDGETYGLDVSSHQGTIDWPAVSRDGISAAYVKASEGGTWRDSHFATNWQGARAAGLRVGAYHFVTLCRDGAEQAENFLGMLRSVDGLRADGALAPVVDLELGGNCSDRPTKEVVLDRLRVFVDQVERESGQQVMFYVLDNFENLYPLPAHLDRPHWERRLVLRPDREWAWWQVNNRARVGRRRGPRGPQRPAHCLSSGCVLPDARQGVRLAAHREPRQMSEAIEEGHERSRTPGGIADGWAS